MDPLGAVALPGQRRLQRVAVAGLGAGLALDQADGLAVGDVDCGQQGETHATESTDRRSGPRRAHPSAVTRVRAVAARPCASGPSVVSWTSQERGHWWRERPGCWGAASPAPCTARGHGRARRAATSRSWRRWRTSWAAPPSPCSTPLDLDALRGGVDEAADALGGLDVLVVAIGVAAFGPADADGRRRDRAPAGGQHEGADGAGPRRRGADRPAGRVAVLVGDPRRLPDGGDGRVQREQGRPLGVAHRAATGAAAPRGRRCSTSARRTSRPVSPGARSPVRRRR